MTLPVASSSGQRKGEKRKDVHKGCGPSQLTNQRTPASISTDAVTGTAVPLGCKRHLEVSCMDQAVQACFGEDSGEWASLSLPLKFCEVL